MAKQYIQQSILEKELLYFGYEAFGITFVDPVSEPITNYPSHCASFHAALKYTGWCWTFYVTVSLFYIQDTWTPEDVMPKKLRDKQK